MTDSGSSRTIAIVSSRPWNSNLLSRLSNSLDFDFVLYDSQEDFNLHNISSLNPEWIFVVHWSHYIPHNIWSNWNTVIFHMTDLPYGRGGSPLQNLILKGYASTKLTALKCCAELDAGDIYCQEDLALDGSAEEIFIRADAIIERLIQRILLFSPIPYPQIGTPYMFKRRTPSDSNLKLCPDGDLSTWYDYIRMLDAEGYPHAYVDICGMRMQFRRVSRRTDGLHADVVIFPLTQE